MKVWLVKVGEQLPVGISKADWQGRTGLLAAFLARRGHDVTWWSSTFDHVRKQQQFKTDQNITITPGLELRLLRGCGYARNVSIQRLRDHLQIARKFRAAAAESETPDIIVASLPTIELCKASVEYGARVGIPVVLDMRDMWPDIFADVLPRPLRPLGRLLLSPWYLQARQTCARATAIIGITDQFVEWGVRRAGRPRGPLDRTFPIPYDATEPANDRLAAADRFWSDFGLQRNDHLTVCYLGSMGRQLDLVHVIDAAAILNARNRPIRFVLCGRGERLDSYRRRARHLSNIYFPGWIDAAQVWSLMRRSDVGLDPLPDRYDFVSNVNNKAVEYLSAGLPIISSPRRGVLHDLLARESCGLSYSPGSSDELVGLLEQVQADREALQGMAVSARRLFERHFSADVVNERLTKYLTEVAAVTPPRPSR
jgi:glycosyltransferase involved in cell wall biosynthesis